MVFLSLILINKISIKLRYFKKLFNNTFRNPRIIRDLSLGGFINGLFSMFNASNLTGFLGYLLLTLIAMIGIINADKNIEKSKV